MDKHPTLFDWADAQARRPTAVIIDARRLFQKRTLNFVRMVAIGYPFKTSGGAEPISIETERARRVGEAAIVTAEEGRASA